MNYILKILPPDFSLFENVNNPDEFITRIFFLVLLIPIISISYYFVLKGIGYLFTYSHKISELNIKRENAKNIERYIDKKENK